jgi:hypothetical protein
MVDVERDYLDEDLGNIVSMEHINLRITDQATATLFYVLGLGLTRDPYLWVGLDNMWINVGEQQFHLPTSKRAQVIPGCVGLVVPDQDQLQARLKAVQDRLGGTRFAWSVEADGCVAVTCPWGNRVMCYPPGPRFGDMILGIPYVEFWVKPGTAKGIARFYEKVMRAPIALQSERDVTVARVSIGRNQWLLFRETAGELPPYDGHHIAVYVAHFSGLYRFMKRRNLIMDDVTTHQFRFKELVDPESGVKVFELEHEVRSLRHPLYHRSLVNRNPCQTQERYTRGRDALIPFTD